MILLLMSLATFGQQAIKNLHPKIGQTPDLSVSAEEAVNRRNVLMKTENRTELETQELEALFEKLPSTFSSIWEIVGGGCNWYEAGGQYKTKASSYLKAEGGVDYKPGNAGDLNFKTAWVPDTVNDGIGAYIQYYFKNNSPRINSIMIYNGYVKSDKAWQDNARVKKIELSINNKPYAILHLDDTKAKQTFTTPPLGHRSDKKDLVLKFKILETYPGEKYKDVAITEIFFDGLDVHCFPKGTKITMADGSFKNIESLQIGDTILSYNTKLQTRISAPIIKMETATHHRLVKYIFEDGTSITATADHPLLLDQKSWSSLDPNGSKQYLGYEQINQIETGDYFFKINIENKLIKTKLKRIETIDKPQETYTISHLGYGCTTFIADGCVVGTEIINLDF